MEPTSSTTTRAGSTWTRSGTSSPPRPTGASPGPDSDFEAQLATAWRVVGAYETATGRLVGFARAISDGVAYGYLSDVFVTPAARGAGLGKELVATTIDRGPGAHFRWSLHTSDAHGLYRQFGFAPPDTRYLERPSHPSPSPRPPTATTPPHRPRNLTPTARPRPDSLRATTVALATTLRG